MESVLEMVQVCCIIGTHTNVAQHSGFGVTFQLRVKQGRQHSAHQQQPSSSPDTQPLKRWLWPTISTPCLIEYKIDLLQSREKKRGKRESNASARKGGIQQLGFGLKHSSTVVWCSKCLYLVRLSYLLFKWSLHICSICVQIYLSWSFYGILCNSMWKKLASHVTVGTHKELVCICALWQNETKFKAHERLVLTTLLSDW